MQVVLPFDEVEAGDAALAAGFFDFDRFLCPSVGDVGVSGGDVAQGCEGLGRRWCYLSTRLSQQLGMMMMRLQQRAASTSASFLLWGMGRGKAGRDGRGGGSRPAHNLGSRKPCPCSSQQGGDERDPWLSHLGRLQRSRMRRDREDTWRAAPLRLHSSLKGSPRHRQRRWET